MSTLAVGPEVDELIERRRALGLDGRDEVWNGVYHVVPHAHSRHGKVEMRLALLLAARVQALGLDLVSPFNLGRFGDYRVPDLAVRDPGPDALFVPTARLVVEVLSPGDETLAKFSFYGSHGVEEILVADPAARTVRLWRLFADGTCEPIVASAVLGLAAAELEATIDWP